MSVAGDPLVVNEADGEASENWANSDLVLASINSEICPLGLLLQGANALVMLFFPYCFGDDADNTMEKLLKEMNDEYSLYDSNDVRVVVITSEAPTTNRQWLIHNDFNVEVYADTNLLVSNAMVGSFDLSLYMLESKNVHMGSIFVPMPAVVIIDGDTGGVISKYIMASPEAVHLSSANILQIIDENDQKKKMGKE